MKKTLVLAGAVALVCSGAAHAQGGWRMLGIKTVGANSDRDVVYVSGKARYSQIRLCGTGAPIHMMDLDVLYANGGREDIQVRNKIKPETCSRNIDLKGQRRNITQIRMRYEKVRPGSRTPVIRVYGR